jgi:CheY-like chemotaxis protein
MGKKILLADDSITIQKVIELTFSDEDFEVVTVGNGRLAVEKVQDVRPDLVLCDIIMPEKDGYEVCDFIKKTPSLAHIPVLLLTGAFEPFDQGRATRVGCDGFLAKPFEPQTLIAKVKDLLNQAATRTISGTSRAAAAASPPVAASPALVASPAPAPRPPAISDPMGSGSAAFPEPVAPRAATAAAGRASAFEDAESSFISDEPLEETPTMITPAYTEMARSPYDEPPMPPPAALAPEDLSYVEELPEPEPEPAELMDVSPEESSTLHEPPSEGMDDAPSPWAQPTVEVSLETRAQAGIESASPQEPAFDEVFEEEAPAHSTSHGEESADAHVGAADDDFGFVRTQDVIGSPAAPSVPSAAAPETVREGFGWVRQADLPETPPAQPGPAAFASRSAPAPEKRSPEPREFAASPPESSFSSVTDADAGITGPATASVAAEVGVPVEMVEKIAQRVVAQISEKVIREIAWEVIPDLAEILIKKEIDRLKAELQQT